MKRRVAITGAGVVNAAVSGGMAALAAWLEAPSWPASAASLAHGDASFGAEVREEVLAPLFDPAETRRLSRASRLTVAAARLALADARLTPDAALGLVVGTETGDLRSTMEFADGYLARGPAGLSALLFPNTVMNTMASATSIAVQAREFSLTLAAPVVAGELAVARGAAAVASGRADAVLAGGVDQRDVIVHATTAALGGGADGRGDGAAFVVLEALDDAVTRGATLLGEIRGAAWRGLRARTCGVGRGADPRAILDALDEAGVDARDIRWVYASRNGDTERDAWERRLLAAAFGAHAPPVASLAVSIGRHAGLGALHVGAALWTAQSGRLPCSGQTADATAGLVHVGRGPGLVHGVARGGTHVALVIGPAERER